MCFSEKTPVRLGQTVSFTDAEGIHFSAEPSRGPGMPDAYVLSQAGAGGGAADMLAYGSVVTISTAGSHRKSVKYDSNGDLSTVAASSSPAFTVLKRGDLSNTDGVGYGDGVLLYDTKEAKYVARKLASGSSAEYFNLPAGTVEIPRSTASLTHVKLERESSTGTISKAGTTGAGASDWPTGLVAPWLAEFGAFVTTTSASQFEFRVNTNAEKFTLFVGTANNSETFSSADMIWELACTEAGPSPCVAPTASSMLAVDLKILGAGTATTASLEYRTSSTASWESTGLQSLTYGLDADKTKATEFKLTCGGLAGCAPSQKCEQCQRCVEDCNEQQCVQYARTDFCSSTSFAIAFQNVGPRARGEFSAKGAVSWMEV